LFAALLETCAETTRLCVAADLTLPGETISSRTISGWRRKPAPPGKRPAVFLLLAQGR
jgi:16S rRNA (cytidine1402-2'-O)-methyltransferase